MTPDAASSASTDAIVAALARLRGRRGPRPLWAGGEADADDSAADDRRAEGPPWARGGHAGHHPGFGHGHHGPPPWWGGGQGRFAGPARLRLLEALAAASAPLSVGEIADAVGVDQPRASRLVQQSVELGLVRREADPDDARRTRIALTDEGSRLVRGFRGERSGAVEAALGGFTEAERAELARLLTKLAAAWPS